MSSRNVLSLPRKSEFAWCIDISPDGKLLASGGKQEETGLALYSFNVGVRLWNSTTLEELDQLEGFNTNSIKFSPDSRYLACGKSAQVFIWNVSGENSFSLEGHESHINRIAFSPDGTRLAAACADGTVQVWNINTKDSIVFQAHDPKMICGYDAGTLNVAFSPNGGMLASDGCDDKICFWDSHTGKYQGFHFSLRGINPIYHIAFSPNGNLLAIGAERSTEIWGMSSKKQECILFEGNLGRRTVVFSRDGQLVAGAIGTGLQNEIGLWKTNDIANGHPERKIELREENLQPISDLVFSQDSHLLYSAHSTEVRRWRLAEHINQSQA